MRGWPRAVVVAMLVGAAPASPAADSIDPFPGDCPPGLERGIAGHAEACIPRVCRGNADCGSDATCVSLCTCRAYRAVSEGRLAGTVPRELEIGFCAADGTCSEGRVVG